MALKPMHVTLTLIQAKPDDPTTFHPTVEGYGTPDFTIRAKNMKTAKEALKEYLYNELDCAGEISDGEV